MSVTVVVCSRSSSHLVGVHLELGAIFGLVREALELMVTIWSETTFTFLWARLQVRELWQEMLGVISLVKLWLVWWRHRLVGDARPVDLVEPGMRHDFLCVSRSATQARVWILMEQFDTEIAGVLRQEVIVEPWLRILDILVELLAVFAIERRQTDEHLIDDGSEGPPISGLAVSLPLQHLG